MDYNDFELVCLANEGNEDAINLIYQKYRPIIIKKSKNAILYATHHGIDINDIMQEGFLGLDEAIKNFSQDGDASFYTFALLCIDRQIINYLRRTTGKRDKLLNDSINIDDNLERTIRDNTDIEYFVLKEEENEYLINKLRRELTEFEKEVFELKLEGYSVEEIANKLNRDGKSIYNTIHRIKDKFKKVI